MITLDETLDPEVKALAARAASFLTSQTWCTRILGGRLGWATAGVLGVFQFDVESSRAGVDTSLWVIVGDLPPAYLVLDEAPTWHEALEGYVEEMQGWVDAIRAGTSLDDVIPVDVPGTRANADLLATRLAFIRDEILAADSSNLESDA